MRVDGNVAGTTPSRGVGGNAPAPRRLSNLAAAAELGAAGTYTPRVQATYPLEQAKTERRRRRERSHPFDGGLDFGGAEVRVVPEDDVEVSSEPSGQREVSFEVGAYSIELTDASRRNLRL